jgi:cytochrome c oxidase subunit I
MTYGTQAEAAHGDRPHGWRRWAYSTNHKEIGTMYLIFAIVGGVIGGILSMGMRAELMYPGMQIFGDPEVFHTIVSAHGLIMIFFTIVPAKLKFNGTYFAGLAYDRDLR